jgi:hypothetical protein
MSEFMFGATRRKLTKKEENLRDRICCEEGGYGYTQIKKPTGEWIGWFSAPNRGNPFDQRLANRIFARLEKAEGQS